MCTKQVLSATSNGEKLRDNSSEISVPLRIYLCFVCCTVFWFHIMPQLSAGWNSLGRLQQSIVGSSCSPNAAKWCPGAPAAWLRPILRILLFKPSLSALFHCHLTANTWILDIWQQEVESFMLRYWDLTREKWWLLYPLHKSLKFMMTNALPHQVNIQLVTRSGERGLIRGLASSARICSSQRLLTGLGPNLKSQMTNPNLKSFGKGRSLNFTSTQP